MGIAQRHVQVSRAHIRVPRIPRKSLPTSMKTFGDLLKLKRYGKGITLERLGSILGIAQVTLRAWERDLKRPNELQMDRLAVILGLENQK